MRASEILRVTQGSGTPSLLGKALAEYGRIAKTEHLLDFIDIDESYRRHIYTQLTLQESRHALARFIFHGRRGQIRQSYREGQEDQLGALGLVLNAIILWHTRYLGSLTGNGLHLPGLLWLAHGQLVMSQRLMPVPQLTSKREPTQFECSKHVTERLQIKL